MNKNSVKKLLDHHDKDEIISKLIIGISPKDIHEWLKAKYSEANEKSLVLSENLIKNFQKNYLDIYSMLQEDVNKTRNALATSSEDSLELSVKNNSAYKSAMLDLANNEVDVKKMITRLCLNVEIRLGQIFDLIQRDPEKIDTRVDRLLTEYIDKFQVVLEKYYKYVEQGPDQVIQHNITLQAVDQHISVFHDVIKEILSQMDVESAMYFMEVFNDKMSKLKPPSDNLNIVHPDIKLAEAKILNQTINEKLNETQT